MKVSVVRTLAVLALGVAYGLIAGSSALGQSPVHDPGAKQLAIIQASSDRPSVVTPWSEVAGRTVRFDGVAWEVHKGYGSGDNVFMESAIIPVKGVDFNRGGYVGKMVRMIGVLEKTLIQKSPPGYQGLGQDTVHYSVKITKWELIDRIERPYLEVLP
jgi:hypothetical protein